MNQEQIKNKTYNWCKKLYENGLFDVNNYNDCIASFNHDHQGEIPNNLQKLELELKIHMVYIIEQKIIFQNLILKI